MSHTVYNYPKTRRSRPHPMDTCPWAVREDNDGYARSLLRLTDAITERLGLGQALTWVLQDSREAQRDGTICNAAWAIADLIHEARELYVEQWERVRKYAKLEG